MIPPEEKQRIFEIIELPTLIRNEKVPTLTSPKENGEICTLFKRNGEVFEMHKIVYDILEKHDLLNGIIDYLAKETVVTTLLLCDDEGPKFKVGLKKQ